MALLLPIWFSLQALPGEESCPSPLEVEARVRGILHVPAEREMGESFLIERHEAGLYVELRGTDSVLIGQRTLAYAPAQTCEDMAQAAAVVLAAWLTHVHPDFAGELPEPELPPKPQSPPEIPKPPEAPKPSPTSEVRAPPPRSAPRAPYALDLALAVGSDYTARQFVLAGYGAVALVPKSGGIGLGLSVIPTTARSQGLAPGSFHWSRSALVVGPVARLGALGLIWDASGGPALGWLRFAGGAFEHKYQPGGVTWGGLLSLRASLRGRWGGFALIEAQLYPAKSSAYATGVGQEWVLPRANVGLFVGARLWP